MQKEKVVKELDSDESMNVSHQIDKMVVKKKNIFELIEKSDTVFARNESHIDTER